MQSINLKISVNTLDLATQFSEKDYFSQAEFINFLANRLSIICKDPDLTGAQICGIADKLDSNGIMFIKSLCEFIEISEE